MSNEIIVLITLIAYKIALIAIGIIASERTKDTTDFYLGGRKLGPIVAAISASASSSSAWTLLGVSGAAYAWGLSAMWIFPACLGGFLINWYILAPHLHKYSHKHQTLTLTEVITRGTDKKYHIAKISSFIVVFSLLFYVASQFQASAKTFSATFDLSFTSSLFIGAVIIVFYTLLGGFWAVSITDTLQGLLMAVSSIILPIAAFIAVGSSQGLYNGLIQVDTPGYLSLTRNMPIFTGVGFVLGLLGIGLGYPGQPHVVNRFMAIKDEKSLLRARKIAISWACCVYLGMILLGLCGRILYSGLEDKEQIFITVAQNLFHPVVGGIIVASVLSAIMSTADSQLLVAASSITHDWSLGTEKKKSHKEELLYARGIVLILSAGAIAIAYWGTKEIFSNVLFAWTAMGAALGPVVIVRVIKGNIAPLFTLLAIVSGFVLSVITFNIPATRGTFWERVFPFIIAFIIAILGYYKQSRIHPNTTEK